MNPITVMRQHVANVERSRQMLEEIREGIANQNATSSRQMLQEIREGIANLTDVTNRHLVTLTKILASTAEEVKAAERRQLARQEQIQKFSAQPTTQLAAFDKSVSAVPKGSSRSQLSAPAIPRSASATENDLASRAHIFDDIPPYSGTPPIGFFADWLGVLHDGKFRSYLGSDRDTYGGVAVTTTRPTLEDGEGWFEAVNQVEAARDARNNYVMVTLGACYGAQAVGSAVALRKLNPIPFKLVAVEPEPVNYLWTVQHLSDNGIDPHDHWLIKAAISDSNSPIFFPVGAPGSGAQNSYATNEAAARENFVQVLIESGRQDEALRNLLLRNTTGLKKSLLPGEGFDAEITLLSAVTLADILAPLPIVDYLESDIQQSEILVFPPFMDLLKRRVRRIHIGTHGKDVHAELSNMFRRDGWDIIFDFEPNSSHTHPMGAFELNDGVLTVRNPNLQ